MEKYVYFTSECVSPGHPDKIADQISDAILDAILEKDKNARVACETMCTRGQVIVAGEIKTKAYVDIQNIVRKKIKEIGYTQEMGFSEECGILNAIQSQSDDISRGVDFGGAGDQGMMFGGAVNETPELMPLALILAREIIILLTKLTRSNKLNWARPDAKSQVTLAYDHCGNVCHTDTVVLSVQHNPEVTQEQIYIELKEQVIYPIFDRYNIDPNKVQKYYINPTGRFVIGGPYGDTGLTGRKIIVDTYGGYFRHGGGAFSGKDSSKVDRSGAYAARWIAKNLVSANLAKKCEVQLSYAIGIPDPVSINIDTFGTSNIDNIKLSKLVRKTFDLSVKGIENKLQLRNPQFKYQDLAALGHMGRTDITLPWENIDKVEELIYFLNIL